MSVIAVEGEFVQGISSDVRLSRGKGRIGRRMNMPTHMHPVTDLTKAYRHRCLSQINIGSDRAALERTHGRVWDLRELAAAFVIVGFMAPFIVVKRKADGKVGSLEFQHHPRFYFGWREDL